MRHLVCDKSGAGTAPLAFWGYCRIIGGGSVLSHEAAQFGDGNKQANFLLERLTALDRQTPQFLFSYLYLPGHFPNKHRLKNAQHVAAYRKVVVEKNRMAAHALEEILAHLKRHDPNAIVFLFGDHGMLHSSERSIHTAFGALGAVWPPNRCTAELGRGSQQRLHDDIGHRACSPPLCLRRPKRTAQTARQEKQCHGRPRLPRPQQNFRRPQHNLWRFQI